MTSWVVGETISELSSYVIRRALPLLVAACAAVASPVSSAADTNSRLDISEFRTTVQTEAAALVKHVSPSTNLAAFYDHRKTCFYDTRFVEAFFDGHAKFFTHDKFKPIFHQRFNVENPSDCRIDDMDSMSPRAASFFSEDSGRIYSEVHFGSMEIEALKSDGVLDSLISSGLSQADAARFITLHEASHARTFQIYDQIAQAAGKGPGASDRVAAWLDSHPDEARYLHPEVRPALLSNLDFYKDPLVAIKTTMQSGANGEKVAAYEEALADATALHEGRKLFGWGKGQADAVMAWREITLKTQKSDLIHATQNALKSVFDFPDAASVARAEAESAISCRDKVSSYADPSVCGMRPLFVAGFESMLHTADAEHGGILKRLEVKRDFEKARSLADQGNERQNGTRHSSRNKRPS